MIFAEREQEQEIVQIQEERECLFITLQPEISSTVALLPISRKEM